MRKQGGVRRTFTEYLIGKGHRSVGYIDDLTVESVGEKGCFFNCFMGRHGGTVVTATGNGLFSAENGDDGVDMDGLRGLIGILTDGEEKITALFLPSNRLFSPVLAILKDADICPMDDIEIVSCVNTASDMRCMNDCSAAIDINLEAIGKRAAECVFWRLDNPDEEPIQISVRPRLIIT